MSEPQAASSDYYTADDEISLLDLLVVVAQNLRLLIFGQSGHGQRSFPDLNV